MHFFLILQLWLAPFFNISSLSDLKYNLHKYREKSDFFGKNRIFSGKYRIFSGKYRIFSEKSAIFADFFPIFLQKIFPPENLFHHHRKPIFRRKIGRKNRFFCPWVYQEYNKCIWPFLNHEFLLLLIIDFLVILFNFIGSSNHEEKAADHY